ncbi:hypothetical protein [Paenibacillus sp. MER 99-2]|uniref:hypothetical protein n=1 Tax=Paenibacillus sp. MER 99-2 TaxID=2939572 RepID=UPI00204262E0|nr:hypothetical protein [Paenibacillus sp. MER 99-2]MCM3174913.1 hypothetical protein [Paenibacillus sp. MER 99-2]
MDMFQYLDELQVDLSSKHLEEIEEKYFRICSRLAGVDRALAIKQVNLNEYVNDLKSGLHQSITLAQQQLAKAIYFEYDLDNNWDSAFYICEQYSTLEDHDDDWASDWLEDLEGPSLEAFANIYALERFDGNATALGSTIYLIARTVVSYAKAYQSLPGASSLAVCIAFHDQDPILRMKKS